MNSLKLKHSKALRPNNKNISHKKYAKKFLDMGVSRTRAKPYVSRQDHNPQRYILFHFAMFSKGIGNFVGN